MHLFLFLFFVYSLRAQGVIAAVLRAMWSSKRATGLVAVAPMRPGAICKEDSFDFEARRVELEARSLVSVKAESRNCLNVIGGVTPPQGPL
jgi:hypothetical protein